MTRTGIGLLGVLAAIAGLGGCARMGHHFGRPIAQVAASGVDNQVPAFDGHDLWVDYVCDGGQGVTVKYLGAFADAKTSDGVVHRLARLSGGDAIAYLGDGYELRGPALGPTWTANGAAPVQCRGRT